MLILRYPDPHEPPALLDVRLRWFFEQRDGRTVPVLKFDRGRRELTREVWLDFEVGGAHLVATTQRDVDVVREALGADVRVRLEAAPDGQ
jgi:hypothetical protein